MEVPNISLPIAAFRPALQDGSIGAEAMPKAGSYNIPSISREDVRSSVPMSIDYLTLMYSCEGNIAEEIRQWEEVLEVRFDEYNRILREKNYGCETVVQGSGGSTFSYKYLPDCVCEVRINGGGSVYSHMEEAELRRVFQLHQTKDNARCTRLDICADDTTGTLDLGLIHQALAEGRFQGFLCGEFIESFHSAHAGRTVYFGGRKSDSRVRFYDKAAEMGLDVPTIRQEYQTRAKRAQEVYLYLFSEGEGFWQKVSARLYSSITFVLEKEKNLSRSVVVDFWREWGALLKTTTIPKARIRKASGLERTLSWMTRSVSKAMKKASEAFTAEGFQQFIDILCRKGEKYIEEKEWDEIEKFRTGIEEKEYLYLLSYSVKI